MSGDEPVSRHSVLDLSHFRSADDLPSIGAVDRVGIAVVPESLAAAFAALSISRVGATVYVPDGARVRTHTGVLTVGGDGLGAEDDLLVVAGLLIVTSPVAGPVPRQISVVGSVLAPRGSESVLGPALSGGTGDVSYYPYVDGQNVQVLSGQVNLSAASLRNSAGGPEDVLVAAGQVMVTGPITEVGYRQVVVAGQFVAPASSRDVLEPRARLLGQSAWYDTERPRFLAGDARVGADFFRLLDQPVGLILLGDMVVEPDVTEAMIMEKVTEIVLLGDLTAPAELVSVLQVLAVNSYGEIRPADDGPGE